NIANPGLLSREWELPHHSQSAGKHILDVEIREPEAQVEGICHGELGGNLFTSFIVMPSRRYTAETQRDTGRRRPTGAPKFHAVSGGSLDCFSSTICVPPCLPPPKPSSTLTWMPSSSRWKSFTILLGKRGRELS